jgi:hypothetical protein
LSLPASRIAKATQSFCAAPSTAGLVAPNTRSGIGKERGWGLFPDGWTGEVLHFVIEVWEELRLPKAARSEPRITKLLAGAIIERYEREERDWFCSPEETDWNSEGKEVSRTDLRLRPPGRKRRSVALVLESKRLNTPASNASEYVGAGGMMCFIPTKDVPAKYAAGLPCGVMLGYVMDGDLWRAYAAICKTVVEKRLALLLASDGEHRTTPLLDGNQWHGQTKHLLPDGEFIIYHLLLPVRWMS